MPKARLKFAATRTFSKETGMTTANMDKNIAVGVSFKVTYCVTNLPPEVAPEALLVSLGQPSEYQA